MRKPKTWALGLSTLMLTFALFSACDKAEEKKSVPSKPLEGEAATGVFPYKRLSTYGFFTGEMKNLQPDPSVVLYKPASSLFTDYASKTRFVYIPEGTKAQIVGNDLNLPLGSVLIKNFYYPADFRKPEGERQIIETRLMVHEEKGWQAYPYVWNEEQTDAVLKVVGAEIEVKFTDQTGKEQVINYLVPNKNQCKSCHNKSEQLAPIGVKVQHLNHVLDYGATKENQLAYLTSLGKLEGFQGASAHPSLINYEDQDQALNDRAMAYLDINCAHCHSAEGPASTSGLFLTYDQRDPMKLGINKAPVAAGKGSGSFKFDVVPGKADQSILIHRMNSTEVGVAMPELGRTTVHQEGVELIREWINSLESGK
jgi:uncharacterized repeat protein (TIGR03806 family)